MGNCNSNKTP